MYQAIDSCRCSNASADLAFTRPAPMLVGS
jgi:hypothetical protein